MFVGLYIRIRNILRYIYILKYTLIYMDITTIRVSKEVKNLLDVLKVHPRETYNDVLKRLIKIGQEQNE